MVNETLTPAIAGRRDEAENVMIEYIGRGAAWLDAWLREHMGRAYSGVLGVGLVLGIGASFDALSHAMSSGTSIAKLVGMVLFELALLVNQLAQFHEFRQERRQRRAARRGGGTAPPPRE